VSDVDATNVVEFLLTEGRATILRRFHADSCVASTRVVIEVLDYFGIRAKPQPVRLRIFNPEATRLVAAGVELLPEHKDAGAWIVEVEGTGRMTAGADGRRRWDGHLVAVAINPAGPDVAIDLSLDQASRPQRNIRLEPTSFVLPDGWRDRPFGIEQNGCTIAYTAIDSGNWRAGDWTERNRWSPAAAEIIRNIRTRSA
jgi:hypothetical protein